MKEPRRLVDEHPSPLARSLLNAGRAEEPQSSLLENTLMATIGVVPLVLNHPPVQSPSAVNPANSVTAASASAGSVKAMTLLAASVKWVGIVSVGGALTISGVRGYRAIRPNPVAASHAPLRAGAKVVEPSVRVAPEPAIRLSPADSFEPASAASAQRAVKTTSSSAATPQALLSEEARLIDDARAAVARGNGSEALRVLDAHRRRFERPRLRPEALYLRMQALRLQGNINAASHVAERLLADYPNGTQSAAARALLNTREH